MATLLIRPLPQWFRAVDLRRVCAPHGQVLSAHVIRDPWSQYDTAGVIETATGEEAARVAAALHRSECGGQPLAVSLTRTRIIPSRS